MLGFLHFANFFAVLASFFAVPSFLSSFAFICILAARHVAFLRILQFI